MRFEPVLRLAGSIGLAYRGILDEYGHHQELRRRRVLELVDVVRRWGSKRRRFAPRRLRRRLGLLSEPLQRVPELHAGGGGGALATRRGRGLGVRGRASVLLSELKRQEIARPHPRRVRGFGRRFASGSGFGTGIIGCGEITESEEEKMETREK